ncbi:alkaline phosphatase family protein [Arcticibacterium luteifluviistationis]|uniref:Alkaline phosphatase family protein n=1 Tax=Arcticibacterium luteifluviistationis TaxID=1784714 RepID=A0A2Z4GGQ9_9BACT|nr:ectonucleotide pyrophosphatase/phosphodiesterase [Arcticibacterium luteifluviistationis]AWW00372.1 alkaline phosphatase family protein [Arcticibacterium luteifluviistationis]
MKFNAIILTLLLMSSVGYSQEKNYVLLVSFDGFRHDYVEKYDATNFKKFISKGTASEGLIPSFPSKTFPNHYSIITGLYPGNHGLVANTFYDPKRKANYRISNRPLVEDPYYYGGTPLWQLSREEGYKAASYFWVGSEAPIKGHFPDYYHIYEGSIKNNTRVDEVIKWLQLPEKDRPRFVSLYFSLVDSQGHRTGPNSKELEKAVNEADEVLGYLMNSLKKVNLPVNVIVVSDHGMKEVKRDDSIDFNQLAEKIPPYATVVYDKILSMVFLPKGDINSIYDSLKKEENNFKVYKKGELPKKWHYNKHERIGDLVLVADPGFAFRKQPTKDEISGEHGYDPYTTIEMRGILYAQGPHINVGVTTEPIENVNIFPLITKILGYKNPKIDGRFRRIKKFYKK